MKNLAFHSLLIRFKDDYCTNSHYLTYTFLFERLGKCTFWTWEWKGSIVGRNNIFQFFDSPNIYIFWGLFPAKYRRYLFMNGSGLMNDSTSHFHWNIIWTQSVSCTKPKMNKWLLFVSWHTVWSFLSVMILVEKNIAYPFSSCQHGW